MELDYLITRVFENMTETCTLLYLHGPSNTGKSYFGSFLSHIFGPAVFTDQKQFVTDTLIFDDACKREARCIYMDEFGSFVRPEDDFEFARIVKRLLAGVATEPRCSKTGKRGSSILYIDLVIITSNFPPNQFAWFQDEAVKRRLLPIYVNNRIQQFDWIVEANNIKVKYNFIFKFINEKRSKIVTDYKYLNTFNSLG
jgi:hypothetical protein